MIRARTLALATLFTFCVAHALAAAPVLKGTWIYESSSNKSYMAFTVDESGGWMGFSIVGGLLEYGEGQVTEQQVGGKLRVTLAAHEVFPQDGSNFSDLRPPNDEETVELRMINADSGEIWNEDDQTRRGSFRRTATCDLKVVFHADRPGAAPPGCRWEVVREIGYDGLIGECARRDNEEWITEVVRQFNNPENPNAGCVIAVPAETPRN